MTGSDQGQILQSYNTIIIWQITIKCKANPEPAKIFNLNNNKKFTFPLKKHYTVQGEKERAIDRGCIHQCQYSEYAWSVDTFHSLLMKNQKSNRTVKKTENRCEWKNRNFKFIEAGIYIE